MENPNKLEDTLMNGKIYPKCSVITTPFQSYDWNKPFGNEEIPVPKAPLDKQVEHYNMAISPVEFIVTNNLPFIEGNIIKYICRHKKKGGAEDIRKVIHYCELLLKYEYNEKP